MASEGERENNKLDQILESFDLLFEWVTDLGVQQQQMKLQLEKTVDTVGKQTVEQQKMATQLAETGRAVTTLTMAQMRFEETQLSALTWGLKSLLILRSSSRRNNLNQTYRHTDIQSTTAIPKQHMPKVFCPKFNGDNPAIWRDKCLDYFMLVDLEPKHRVRMTVVHFEEPASQWLQVYRKRNRTPTWAQFVKALEEKFGKDDYRKSLTDPLELKQSGSVEEYFREFQELQFQVSMHNDGYGELFFASQFVNGLKKEIRYTVQSQVPEDVDRAVLLAKIQ
jgi:hypothetical protein